jgi:5-methylcytosine-specific restriction enzyme A
MPRKIPEWIGRTPDTPPPPRVKLRIWARENGACYLSGRKILPGEPYEYEHKIAIINGGENRETNIFLALTDKHKEKTKADLAEKSRVADRAKSHIGANSPAQRPMDSRDNLPKGRNPRHERESLPAKRLYEAI